MGLGEDDVHPDRVNPPSGRSFPLDRHTRLKGRLLQAAFPALLLRPKPGPPAQEPSLPAVGAFNSLLFGESSGGKAA